MSNNSYRGVDQLSDPSAAPFAIVPHNTNALPRTAKAIYVGTGGTLLLRAPGSDQDVSFVGVPSGMILPVRASHVRAAGTTADNLVAL
jgi:hypothetical protein